MKRFLPHYETNLQKHLFRLVTLLVIILITSIFASLIQNNWMSVSIDTVHLDTRDNQVLVYDIYVPDGVTEENPAPLVIVIAGFQRSRETQGHVAMELARRGFVVINMDPYSQGDSTSSSGVQGSAIATVEGYGAFDLIDYIYDNEDVYPFTDKDRIGVTGHSAGGNAALKAAIYFGQDSVNNGGVSKVHSIYISGYVLSIQSDIVFAKSNMGTDYALYDEGAFRNAVNDAAPDDFSKSDMVWMIESHDFVNSGLDQEGSPTIPYSEPIQIGKIYGNPNLRNMRQVFNTPTIHAFQPYSVTATANIIKYFEVAMDFRSDSLASVDQVWLYKEVLTSISLIASLAMVLPAAGLLYEIPFFRTSKQDSVFVTTSRSTKGLIVYLILFVIAASVAAFTFLPMSKLSFVIFPKASNSVPTWFYPQRMTNTVMLWAFLNGLFSASLFIGHHYVSNWFKRRNNQPLDNNDSWGVKMPLKNIGKTILIGILIIVFYYTTLNLIQALLHVDYRFLFLMAARRINTRVFLQSFLYVPFFFFFYFSNAIRVNGSQMHGTLPEWAKLTLAALMNISGLAIILFIQYFVFFKTGTIAFTELPDGTTQWLYVNMLFNLIPVLILMPLFNRWFYKISGNSYLGAFVICGLFVIMALSNSVAYIPN